MAKFEFVPKGFTRAKIAEELGRDDFVPVDVGGDVPFDHHEVHTDKCAAELVAEVLITNISPGDPWKAPGICPSSEGTVVTHFSPDADSVIATYLVQLPFMAAVIGWKHPGLSLSLANPFFVMDEFADDWKRDEEYVNAISRLRTISHYAHWADFAEFDKLGESGFAAVVSGLNLIHGRDNESILRDGHKILEAAARQRCDLADLSGLVEAQPALEAVKAEKRAVAKAKTEGRYVDLPNGDRVLVTETTALGLTMPDAGYGTEFQLLILRNPETHALRVLCAPVVGERYREVFKHLAVGLDEQEQNLDPDRPSDREHNWFAHPGGQMLCSPSVEGKVTFDQLAQLVLTTFPPQ